MNIVGSLLCDSIELDVLYIESHLKTLGLLCYYIYAGWREGKQNIFMMKQPESYDWWLVHEQHPAILSYLMHIAQHLVHKNGLL